MMEPYLNVALERTLTSRDGGGCSTILEVIRNTRATLVFKSLTSILSDLTIQHSQSIPRNVIVLGRQVEIVHCRDAGNGWLDVEARVDGRRFGWFEHKSHLDVLKTREEYFEYLGDQAVGLAESSLRPN